MIPEHPRRRPYLLPRLLRGLGWSLAALALLLLLAWALGRIVSDRWVWSQWLFWAVTPAGALPSGILLLAGWALLWCADRARRESPGRAHRKRTLVAISLAALAWTPMIGWRGWAWPIRAIAGTPESDYRLLHWNPAAKRAPDVQEVLRSEQADLIVISNPPRGADWTGLIPEAHIAVAGPGRFVSAHPILRWGWVYLGLSDLYEERERDWRDQPQSGWAAFAEIDTRATLGRTLVVWAVDLPSSPEVPRRDVALRSRRAIDGWSGPEVLFPPESPQPGEVNPGQTPRLIRRAPERDGFPPPDVIVGDFNSPRGAWSADRITSPLRSAYHDLGPGGGIWRCATWPRERPLYQLDQTYIALWLRSCRYQAKDPGATPHRYQVVDLKARD